MVRRLLLAAATLAFQMTTAVSAQTNGIHALTETLVLDSRRRLRVWSLCAVPKWP